MEENPVWAAIWDELERDFEKRRSDGGSADLSVGDTRILSEEV